MSPGRRGGEVGEDVGQAVAGCGLILLSLPNSAIMLDVCAEIAEAKMAGAGAAATDRPLVIDTTTGDPQDSIRAAALLAEAGGGYVDATVSGNAAQATTKDIIFMAGGTDPDVARATEL